MANIISAHNKKLLHEPDGKPKALPCNCRNETQCPMSGRCHEKCRVYRTSVDCSGKTMVTLVCARPNSKRATTITCSRSDTGRTARRLNFRNTSRHARTLVRTLPSHGKSSVRPNHTTMEVDNAVFVSQKNIIS